MRQIISEFLKQHASESGDLKPRFPSLSHPLAACKNVRLVGDGKMFIRDRSSAEGDVSNRPKILVVAKEKGAGGQTL